VPIIAAWSSRIERSSGTTLRIGRRLQLGYDAYPPRPGVLERGTRGALIWLMQGGTLETEGFVALAEGVQVNVGGTGTVRIGDETYINANSCILCTDSIQIGARCAISWGVEILDFDGHRISGSNGETGPIWIGDDVWIGARAIVLKGVEIGEGAVVAAGSVVTRSIPPRSLAAGNPARVIRENVTWQR
jgi:acetyltransferase-like isoleucine patch superfamily enzyme